MVLCYEAVYASVRPCGRHEMSPKQTAENLEALFSAHMFTKLFHMSIFNQIGNVLSKSNILIENIGSSYVIITQTMTDTTNVATANR